MSATLSFRAEPGSFWQALLIEIASGAAFFLLTPLIMTGLTSANRIFEVAAVLLVLAAGTAAYVQSGIIQTYLVEVSVGGLVLLGLEFYLKRFTKYITDLGTMTVSERDSDEIVRQ